MKMLVQMIHFSSKVVHYLVMLVMTSMILTNMIHVHRWCPLAMHVGHVTIPSSLKVYKLVPPLGPHKF